LREDINDEKEQQCPCGAEDGVEAPTGAVTRLPARVAGHAPPSVA
jgi:hypothetical protein